MTKAEIVLIVIQFGTLVALIATVIASYKGMRKQTTAQNLMELARLLLSDRDREARKTVLLFLRDRTDPSDWNAEEQEAAAHVTSTYTAVGMMVRAGLVDKEPLLDTWWRSVIDCREILGPYIDKRRRDVGEDTRYLATFDWLAEQSRAHAERGKGL